MKNFNIFMRSLASAFLCLCLSSTLSAQDGKVSIDLKNAHLRELLSAIEEQTSYGFSYRDSEIDGLTVSFKAEKTAVSEILSKVLPKFGLTWAFANNRIAIIPIEAEKGASVELKGRIVDNADLPVIGATVLLKGTTTGVAADMDGRFTITTKTGDILVISSLGYVSTEYKVGRSNNVKIVLEDDSQLLEEAVAVGYGTTSRKNLTTSIATVKASSISKSANSNISQMLMGQAAGLRANISSPQPGGNVDISIRGGGTPIYIVDGIMMPAGSLEVGHGAIETPNSINRAGLAGLNPGDIESIEILKDASAAIYGINAANGVILITTKKGTEGTPRVTVETSYSFVRNYKYLQPLTSQEYMNFANVFSKESYLLNHDMYPYGNAEYDNG